MASTIKIKRSASAGNAPNNTNIDTAELALNTADRIMYSSDGTDVFEIGANLTSLAVSGQVTLTNIISANGSIGTAGQALLTDGSSKVYWGTVSGGGSSAVRTDYIYTANEGQTTFTGADDDGDTLSLGTIFDVFLNGSLISPSGNYTSNTTAIVFAEATGNNDIVTIRNIETVAGELRNTYVYTANEGQTVFTGSDDNSATLSMTNYKDVFVNGILITDTTDNFTANDTHITFTSGVSNNDIVTIKSYDTVASFSSIDDNGSSTIVTIAANSNVGIGTTTPGYELDVNGSLNTTSLYIGGTQVTSTAAELHIRDGVTATAAELNYVDGVTSNIQTQLDGKVNTTDNNTITSTTAGSSAAPEFELFRDITGADANYIGQIKFSADNDADSKTVFAKITGKIGDASSGTEDGIIEIAHIKDGSQNINVRMTSTEFKIMNGTDFDVETHDGSSTGLRLANSLVTATAAELNLLDGVTGTLVTEAGTQTLTNKTLTAPKIASGGYIADENGNEQIVFTTTASAVNYFTVTNTATGANQINLLGAAGGDTNIGIGLSTKGTGNVLIGSGIGAGSNPSRKLQVYPDSASKAAIGIQAYGTTATEKALMDFVASNGTALTSIGQGAATSELFRLDSVSGYILATGSGSHAGGTERVRIDSSGNVGISTTSSVGSNSTGEGFWFASTEAARFSRASNVALIVNRITTTGDNIALRYDGGTKSSLGFDGTSAYINAFSGTPLAFKYAGSTKMAINTSGNVGIGTTSPGTELEVAGDLTVDGTAYIGDSAQRVKIFDDGNAHIHSTSTTLWINAEDGSDVRINNQYDGNVILTNGTGKVGIGTTSPGAELDIQSTSPEIHLNDSDGALGGTVSSLVKFQANGSTHGTVGFGTSVGNMGLSNSQGNLFLQADTNNAHASSYITFTVDNSTKMRILDSGRVGIGTTSPGYELHVVGDIYATGEITSASSAAAKDNIATIDNALDIVEQLRGVTFDWKESGKKAVGMIYEEVKEVIPELTSNENDHPGVAYQNTVAVLIEAVKTLSAKVKELEAR